MVQPIASCWLLRTGDPQLTNYDMFTAIGCHNNFWTTCLAAAFALLQFACLQKHPRPYADMLFCARANAAPAAREALMITPLPMHPAGQPHAAPNPVAGTPMHGQAPVPHASVLPEGVHGAANGAHHRHASRRVSNGAVHGHVSGAASTGCASQHAQSTMPPPRGPLRQPSSATALGVELGGVAASLPPAFTSGHAPVAVNESAAASAGSARSLRSNSGGSALPRGAGNATTAAATAATTADASGATASAATAVSPSLESQPGTHPHADARGGVHADVNGDTRADAGPHADVLMRVDAGEVEEDEIVYQPPARLQRPTSLSMLTR